MNDECPKLVDTGRQGLGTLLALQIVCGNDGLGQKQTILSMSKFNIVIDNRKPSAQVRLAGLSIRIGFDVYRRARTFHMSR